MSLYDRVKRAADECIPKGEVLAWSHVDGTNITWEELVQALKPSDKLIDILATSGDTVDMVWGPDDVTNKEPS